MYAATASGLNEVVGNTLGRNSHCPHTTMDVGHAVPGACDDDRNLIGPVLDRANGDDAVCRMRAEDRMRGVVGAIDQAIELA